MELVIPIIPKKDHRRRVFSVYALTQASEYEIVDASSSSPNTIPRSKDRVAWLYARGRSCFYFLRASN